MIGYGDNIGSGFPAILSAWGEENWRKRHGLHISRQNMANWTIQCADRYLAVLYDYLQEKNLEYAIS